MLCKAAERLIKYAKVHTASREDTDSVPSSQCQFKLCDMLKSEMLELGFSRIFSDSHAYLYGELPAVKGCENLPAIAFIAHLDTVPDFSGENVKPQIIEDYDGGEIALGSSGKALSPTEFEHLLQLKGHTLITTDGTTVLGADDKAGIAEIMTAFETVEKKKLPHGRIIACFTPDEEIGHGAALLDLERLGADFAFTVDGGAPEEINYETFNACEASWKITGFNIHPGDAKGKMINASHVACIIDSMLPKDEIPERTEGYEGFFHLIEMGGDVSSAELKYIVRDHDADRFEARKQLLHRIEGEINSEYGEGTAELRLREQYRNMYEILAQRPEILEIAREAIRKAGLEPKDVPVRGGTDGAQLSFRGLPCPNLGTGGFAYHGPYEHISSELMEKATEIIINIITQ